MCFSAEASFTLGAGLAVIGIASLRNRTSRAEIPLLAFPLIFAAQQGTEGILWLQLEAGNDGFWRTISTQGFLFYAEVVWPALVAPALYLIEPDPFRKKLMAYMIPYGAIVSLFLLAKMIASPYEAAIVGHSIRYTTEFTSSTLSMAFYAFAVVFPLVISSRGLLVIFGSLVVLSLLITNAFYAHAAISVWCFFAALLSVIIYIFALRSKRAHEPHLSESTET